MHYVQFFTNESVCLTLCKDSEWLQNYLAIEITFLPTESVRLTKCKYLGWLQNHLAPEITFLLTERMFGGCWWFLTRYLEDGVIIDLMDCYDMWFLTCVPNFSSLAWIEVSQDPPVLKVHTWRKLKVPDWSLGGLGHL